MTQSDSNDDDDKVGRADAAPADDTPADEKVGYKHPPKATQFKKGQSGNPKGRPKMRHEAMEAFRRELSGPMRLRVNGQLTWFDSREAYARALVKSACRGSVADIGTILGFVDVSDTLKAVEQERRYGLLIVPEPAADIDAWERLYAADNEHAAEREAKLRDFEKE